MSLNTLIDVFEDGLKDLYSAEAQIARALPKMAKGATTPELKKAFEQHLEVTKKQIERLEQVCKEVGVKPTGKKCEGMLGLLKESEEVLREKGSGPARDAALIMAAQKVEHYEIAGYGSVRTFAEHLGLKKAVRLLQQTLNEESRTDEKLTAIAERSVNFEAEEEEEPKALRGRAAKASGSSSSAGSSARSGSTSKASSSGSRSSSAAGRSSGASSSAGKNATSRSASGRSSSSTSTSKAKKSASSSSSRSRSAGTSGKKGGSAGATTDHEFIRQWAEERGGTPACVRGTGDPNDIGLLRIDFPGYSGEDTLQSISWDEFFEKFEEKKLAFLHQDRTAGGQTSRFFKLVSRDSVDAE